MPCFFIKKTRCNVIVIVPLCYRFFRTSRRNEPKADNQTRPLGVFDFKNLKCQIFFRVYHKHTDTMLVRAANRATPLPNAYVKNLGWKSQVMFSNYHALYIFYTDANEVIC